MSDSDKREWWVYTPESWPEPIAGPYTSYDQAYTAAAWLVGAEDFRIDWTDTATTTTSTT